MRYSLVKPAHEPVDFRSTPHGWLIAAAELIENFVAPVAPVAPDSELAVGFVIDFAPPVLIEII